VIKGSGRVSSYHNDFNYGFGVSFRPEEVASGRVLYNFQPAPEWAAGVEDLSGHSIFYRDADGRFLDLTPKGRNEKYHGLADWARPRNMYGKGGTVEANGRYHAPTCGCAAHK
jgi:predicted dithiol-disulfide oxidoreductase (DUF899 family)